MIADNFWLIAIGSLVGVTCSQVGCFLVLRRLSMLGDAISHTVLLGIVLAFLLTASFSPLLMLLGAIIAGLATAFLSEFISTSGRVSGDAGIGIVFTWFFAIGIILLSFFAGEIHLDLDCILYGELTFAPFDTLEFENREIGPRSFWILLGLALFNSVFVWIGFRPLKAGSFDPVVAKAQGVKIRLWHYLLMAAVSITTVLNIESVGAILVVAMLIVPANTAYLLSRSLISMLFLSAVFAVLSAFFGVFLSQWTDSSPGASIAVIAGVFLTGVCCFKILLKPRALLIEEL